MFLGTFDYKVDNKGRVPLPPKFRAEFMDGLVITHGIEKDYIEIHTKANYEKIAGDLTTAGVSNSAQRMLNRRVFGSAHELELDAQGRISLPAALRQLTQIEDAVTLVGVNDHIELWNPARWESEKALDNAEAMKIIESREGRL
jgi:MraZ protein